jgi:ribonuclease HI
VGLISHTEAKHGRTGVHRGIAAWESARNQPGAITNGAAVTSSDISYDVDEMYDYEDDEWVCSMCYKRFPSANGLSSHLSSAVHEQTRYDCKQCRKQFKTLAGLQNHLNATGHSDMENRLVHTAIHDAQQSQLMLTNGSAMAFEATLYFDGGARPNPGHGGAGYWIYDNIRRRVLSEESLRVNTYPCTNNQAEYTALLYGMRGAYNLGIRNLEVKGDSELVILQMRGEYRVNSHSIMDLYDSCVDMKNKFIRTQFVAIPRADNYKADELATEGIY